MPQTIVGREDEKRILLNMLNSGEAELIAILGRRRVGKTFLVRNLYEKQLVFSLTGLHEKGLDAQLTNFRDAVQQASAAAVPPAIPNNWREAFIYLSEFLKTKLRREPLVVLFDEFPWIHTPKSGFLSAFGHWWNTWASLQPQLKVVICGSAASWMIENIINDRGGLHNRVSRTIRLYPFTLGETEKYLFSRDIILDRYQMVQLYMAMGGIPQYLKQIEKGESTNHVVDKLFFRKNGPLKEEFQNLYRSLFTNATDHETIVRALSKKNSGLTRAQLIETCQFSSGGTTSRLLDELEESGFITQYIPFARTKRDSIYKLSDEYSLFYLKFVENSREGGGGTWQRMSARQSYISWCGYAFEAVCQKHLPQLKTALGIGGVYTEASAWKYVSKKAGETGAQIDMLLDRQDHCINLCEMKFGKDVFTIDKRYAAELENKIRVFTRQTKTKKTIFPTIITPFGVTKNEYYTKLIQSEVKARELFT